MKITLSSGSAYTAGSPLITAEDGRDLLVQTDYDFPGTAESFGWSIRSVQKNIYHHCDHCGTDGTVDCDECGVTALDFIEAARDWIDDNDGAEVDDPGYFEGDE